MDRFDAWHLPPGAAVPTFDTARYGDAELHTARLTPADLAGVCTALQDAGDALRDTPLDTVIDAIDDAAARLLDPDDSLRAEALAWLPRVTGFSPPMAAAVLDRMAADWRAPHLRTLLRSELGDARVLDRFVRQPQGRRVRAFGPRLSLHILAGNVPGVGVTSLIRALLVRAPALCKTAREEPVLPVLFARALRAREPVIADAIAVTWWPGGDAALEDVAFRAADLVVHYGAAAAIADARRRLPAHVHLVEHGPRFSFGVVARDAADDPALPAQIARAAATFDQQGCVSPHLVYIEDAEGPAARALAQRIAAAFPAIEQELPRGRISTAEAAAIQDARATAEFQALGGRDVALWMGSNASWTVIYDDTPTFSTSCLNRTLWCRRISRLEDLPGLVQPFAPLLQSVAVAARAPTAKFLANTLAAAGATRITSFQDLPWPPQNWHHDGRGPLRELLRWVDFESAK